MLPNIQRSAAAEAAAAEATGVASSSLHQHQQTTHAGGASALHCGDGGDDTGASSMLPPVNANSHFNVGGVSTLTIDSKSLMPAQKPPKPPHKRKPAAKKATTGRAAVHPSL